MIVVGLTGKAGAGKSTVADYLVEAHGFTRLSFAAPLKKMLRTLDPILAGDTRLSECATWDETEIKQIYPEYRRLLQVLSTDCIRAVDTDFWVRAAMQQLTDFDGRYVFDDVRFPNEASAVYLSGKKPALWHIARPNHDAGAGAHASEQYAGKMGENYFFHNTGDPEYLYSQVDVTMTHYFDGVPA